MAKRRLSIRPPVPLHLPKHLMILALVALDSTFRMAQSEGVGHRVWLGKCIHCRSALVVDAQGRTDYRTTVEHIVPQSAGGGDVPQNLALACARCNNQKGSRLDGLGMGDPRLVAVVQRLQAERHKRLRAVPSEIALSDLALAWLADADETTQKT
jgi:hypothetical protein